MLFCLHGQTESDRQAGPVSLFSQAWVSDFSIAEQSLDYAKNMLYFCSDGSFSVFYFLGCVLSAFAQLSELSGAMIDPIFDFPALIVADNCVLTLFASEEEAYGLTLARLAGHGERLIK